MRYAGIIYNDTAAAPGLCLSFYTQGCPIRCPGCHNPETWDENGGHEFTTETMNNILSGITRNGVTRSFAVLGGEPLSPHNAFLTAMVVASVREKFPQIQIWLWSGYNMEDILTMTGSPHIRNILTKIDAVVAGPYEQARRDIGLPYRGSRNQKVFLFDRKKNVWYNKENEKQEYEFNVRTE